MRIISGTVKSTPKVWLPTLSHIAPADLRRTRATLNLLNRCFQHESSLLYDELMNPPVQRLPSRPFIWHDIPELDEFRIEDKWRERWTSASPCNYHLLQDPTVRPPGFDLPRLEWSRLNRIRTGHGRCNSCMYKWNLASSPVCDCGADDQTMAHIVNFCPLRRFAGSLQELSDVETDRAKDYLMCLDVRI